MTTTYGAYDAELKVGSGDVEPVTIADMEVVREGARPAVHSVDDSDDEDSDDVTVRCRERGCGGMMEQVDDDRWECPECGRVLIV